MQLTKLRAAPVLRAEVPPCAPAGEMRRGHRFAADPRCWADRRSAVKAGHTLEAAVRAYRNRPLYKTMRELEGFAKEPTVEAAVSRAGLAERFNGKRWVRYDHQRRIPRDVLKLARKKLLAASLPGCSSFHELFRAVESAIRSIPGIGELMVYDTALRIGARLGLEPDRIYIHSGTRVGARRLGLDARAPWIDPHDLPPQLRDLPPWQVEDILCIYKTWFEGEAAQQADAADEAQGGTRTAR